MGLIDLHQSAGLWLQPEATQEKYPTLILHPLTHKNLSLI